MAVVQEVPLSTVSLASLREAQADAALIVGQSGDLPKGVDLAALREDVCAAQSALTAPVSQDA